MPLNLHRTQKVMYVFIQQLPHRAAGWRTKNNRTHTRAMRNMCDFDRHHIRCVVLGVFGCRRGHNISVDLCSHFAGCRIRVGYNAHSSLSYDFAGDIMLRFVFMMLRFIILTASETRLLLLH